MSALVTARRFVRFACAALACWPLAHYALVRTFDLNPWRFAGFAMYSVPRPALQAREVLMGEDASHLRPVPVEQLTREASERLLRILAEGLDARSTWGDLYDAVPQARELFLLSPSAHALTMSIEVCSLDARAFSACRTEQYACARSGESAECRRSYR